jgi:hypothetical protein
LRQAAGPARAAWRRRRRRCATRRRAGACVRADARCVAAVVSLCAYAVPRACVRSFLLATTLHMSLCQLKFMQSMTGAFPAALFNDMCHGLVALLDQAPALSNGVLAPWQARALDAISEYAHELLAPAAVVEANRGMAATVLLALAVRRGSVAGILRVMRVALGSDTSGDHTRLRCDTRTCFPPEAYGTLRELCAWQVRTGTRTRFAAVAAAAAAACVTAAARRYCARYSLHAASSQPELALSLPDESQVVADIGQGLFGRSDADAHAVASCGEHFYCVTGGILEQRRLAVSDAASVRTLDVTELVAGSGACLACVPCIWCRARMRTTWVGAQHWLATPAASCCCARAGHHCRA